MARYIDAELLLADNTYEWFDDWGNYTSAGQAIVDAPTADAVEVVHGEWIYTDGDVGYSQVKCSRCEKMMIFGDEDELYHYCPNCGAKMGKKVQDDL